MIVKCSIYVPTGATKISLTHDLMTPAVYGQTVTFTCIIITNHDTVIVWESPHYMTRPLQFTSDSPEINIKSQDQNIVATIMINKTRLTNGSQVIEIVSELQLIASISSNVSCEANGSDPQMIYFRKSDVGL